MQFIESNHTDELCSGEEYFVPDDIIQGTQSRVSNDCMILPVSSSTQSMEVTDDIFRATIRSLNTKQRYAYEIILKWCGDKVKNLSSLCLIHVDPIYLFISGGAGAGKSHLIKSVYQTVLKIFKHGPSNPDLPYVLLLAPTGVAAVNIGGSVISSSLGIPKNVFGEHTGSLPHERLSALRNMLSELKLIIIDKISMISNRMLKYIHERLKQIFNTPDSVLFAGISLIAVGDFYQLPSIKAKPAFLPFKSNCFNLCHPWQVFHMIELDHTMRQEGDDSFTKLLNRIRVGSIDDDDFKILYGRIVTKSDINYPFDAMHIWAESSPVMLTINIC